MFDRFRNSKFLKKCKSTLNLLKVRNEGIKRKRNAMEKYLKNDISELLRNGFHLNAYSRAAGLLVEINKSACYDFIDFFCKVTPEHLSVMDKQKECPEECKEGVSSLMFAAARFADLPELRELRTIFADKYGKSLDTHVSKEFVEKLKASTPTKDMKIQLLQDIAAEYGVDWDTKSLENQLYKPPITEQVKPKNTDHTEMEIKSRIRRVRERDKQDFDSNDTSNMDEKSKVPSIGKKEASYDDKYKSHDIEITKIDTTNENIVKEKTGDKKPVSYRFIPPPYTITKSNDSETSSQDDSVDEAKKKPKSVRMKQSKPPNGNGTTNEDRGLKVVLEDDSEDKKGNKNGFHSRTISLPPEEISSSETRKGHARAFSLQPDNQHSHPKLLDYDDFVARLAALRQK